PARRDASGSRLADEPQHLVVKQAVRGYPFAAPDRPAPAPVGEATARLLHDREERGAVPDAHDRVEGHLGAAGGDGRVAVAVGPGTLQFGTLDEAVVRPRAGARGALFGHDEEPTLQAIHGRDAAAPAVPRAALAARRGDRLAEGRQVDHPD